MGWKKSAADKMKGLFKKTKKEYEEAEPGVVDLDDLMAEAGLDGTEINAIEEFSERAAKQDEVLGGYDQGNLGRPDDMDKLMEAQEAAGKLGADWKDKLNQWLYIDMDNPGLFNTNLSAAIRKTEETGIDETTPEQREMLGFIDKYIDELGPNVPEGDMLYRGAEVSRDKIEDLIARFKGGQDVNLQTTSPTFATRNQKDAQGYIAEGARGEGNVPVEWQFPVGKGSRNVTPDVKGDKLPPHLKETEIKGVVTKKGTPLRVKDVKKKTLKGKYGKESDVYEVLLDYIPEEDLNKMTETDRKNLMKYVLSATGTVGLGNALTGEEEQ